MLDGPCAAVKTVLASGPFSCFMGAHAVANALEIVQLPHLRLGPCCVQHCSLVLLLLCCCTAVLPFIAVLLYCQVAFMRNPSGSVIYDRRFNTAALLASYYGSNVDFAGRINWDPKVCIRRAHLHSQHRCLQSQSGCQAAGLPAAAGVVLLIAVSIHSTDTSTGRQGNTCTGAG